MQYTIVTLTTLFAAALSAPSAGLSPRQAIITGLDIWSRAGCADGSFTGSRPVYEVTTCQTLEAGITASKLQNRLPAGCTLVFHTDANCQSSQTYTAPQDQDPNNPTGCFEAGTGRVWGSVIASGTCA